MCAGASTALGQDLGRRLEVDVPRFADIPVGRIDRSYDPAMLVPLSALDASSATEVREALRQPRPYATAVDTVAIDPRLLLLPAESDALMGVNTVPRELAHTALTIAGHQYVLYVVSVVPDPKYGMRHVTAAIMGAPDAYARFTIDQRTGRLVGTVHTNDFDYRFLPLSDRRQAVYRLSDDPAQPELSRRYLTVSTAGSFDDLAIALEARHTQVELLGDIRPTLVRTSLRTFNVALEGGDLGDVEVVAPTGEDIGTLLQRLAPLTHVTGSEEFEITHVLRGGEDYIGEVAIGYRQVIDGVPVLAEREIRARYDGRTLAVGASLIPADFARAPRLVSDVQARSIAIEATAGAYGQASKVGTEDVLSQQLYYRPDTLNRTLRPVWMVTVKAPSGARVVAEIDAETGKVEVRSTAVASIGEDFRHYVCLRTAIEPNACCEGNSGTYGCNPVPGTAIAWQEFNEASLEYTATDPAVDCNDPSLATPKTSCLLSRFSGN
jgi:hypothetical protein